MIRDFSQLLVVDVESTCWEKGPPAGQTSEIIEIGLAVLDLKTLEPQGKRSILVRPSKSEISPFCTQLTGLEPSMFADALPFSEACGILRSEHRSKDRTWASWGDYDRRQFERQCADQKVNYPFGTAHLNVKNLFAIGFGDREMGLGRAYHMLGMVMAGRHHRGDDDAWNIARVLSRMLQTIRTARDMPAV